MADLERIEKLLSRSGEGSLTIVYGPEQPEDMRWSVMGVMGREAEDSPMAGGAVHGLGKDLREALEQALAEARIADEPSSVEWTDSEGTRAVLRDGRLSIYGKPSMTSDTGQVAIGIDVPPGVQL